MTLQALFPRPSMYGARGALHRIVAGPVLVLLALLTSSGCLKPSQPTQPKESTSVSGTISLPDSLRSHTVVVAFVPDYQIFNTADTITSFGTPTPYEFIELHLFAGPSALRSFEVALPEDKSGNRGMIAWIDRNNNLQLDFPAEAARFPTKTHNNATVVITRWTYGFNTSNRLDYFLVVLRNGSVSNLFLSELGNTGFRFTF